VRLSPSRYHAWNGEDQCALDDKSSCPRSSPQQLTAAEVSAIQELVTSDDYRHAPTGTLARLAQRLGKVFASASTWYRLVREHRWRRPRQRVHPAAPKVGIRAARPNEVWHMDTTLIRLLDGSRVYLQAVIDNFSRRVLAWKVSGTFDPNATTDILLTAAQGVSGDHLRAEIEQDRGQDHTSEARAELRGEDRRLCEKSGADRRGCHQKGCAEQSASAFVGLKGPEDRIRIPEAISPEGQPE
jgi:putative transposase